MHKTATLALMLFLLVGTSACGINSMSDYQDAFLDGVAHMNRQKPAEALVYFDRAIALEPTQADAHIGRANALNSLGRHAEAIASYDTAIDHDKSIANAFVNRAIAHSHMGNYRLAIADYEQGLVLDPEIDDPPGFVERIFSNTPNTNKGIRKHLEYLRSVVDQQAVPPEGDAKPAAVATNG